MAKPRLRSLFRVILAASSPVLWVACGSSASDDGALGQKGTEDAGTDGWHQPGVDAGDGGESDAAVDGTSTVDAGVCGDDRPPESQNYPGCNAPYCVPYPGLDATTIDTTPDAAADDAAADGDAAEAGLIDVYTESGTFTHEYCQVVCGNPTGRSIFSCKVVSDSIGTFMKCQPDCTGRRPHGFVPRAAQENAQSDALGRYFASMAALECASIEAFRTLRRELRAHRAPRALLRAASRSARDEVRHTRTARRLARRFHGVVPPAEHAAHGVRSLEAIAIENAVEGCVRETFGALSATHQARVGRDADVRAAFERIAKDETRHAALGWRVHAWAVQRLDAAARLRVRNAMRAAVAELGERLSAEPPPELIDAAGVPDARTARAMFGELRAMLWGAE